MQFLSIIICYMLTLIILLFVHPYKEKRGGGTVCLVNSTSKGLWQSFNSSILSVENCWEYNPCTADSTQCYWCPVSSPTVAPSITAAPQPPMISNAPSQSPTATVVGDVAVIVMNSVNPDSFSVVALADVSVGNELFFTDNGWTGTALTTSEGVLSFLVSTLIPAGKIWSYEGTAPATNTYGTWSKKVKQYVIICLPAWLFILNITRFPDIISFFFLHPFSREHLLCLNLATRYWSMWAPRRLHRSYLDCLLYRGFRKEQ